MRTSTQRPGFLCVLWSCCLLAGLGCQSSYAPSGAAGQPCLEEAECAAGLVCLSFTCAVPEEARERPDAGRPSGEDAGAGLGDAGLSDAGLPDAEGPEEDAGPVCSQGDRRCVGADVERCDPAGWTWEETCEAGCLSDPARCAGVELPNLRARRVEAAPGVYLVGEPISASFLFENSGPLPVAAPVTCDIVLSLDEAYSPDDVSIWSLDADLPAFGVGLGEGEGRLPADLATGLYHVLGVCDPQGLVAEANEADNLGRSEGLVEVVDDPLLTLPDLVPLRLTDAEGGPVELFFDGTQVRATLQASILNQGGRGVQDFTLQLLWSADAAWSVDDLSMLELNVPYIYRGDTRNIELDVYWRGRLESGYLLVIVDFWDDLAESDEENNTLAVPVEVVLDPTLERCMVDRFEPNETAESAPRLEPGRYEELLICIAERDFYQLCPPAGAAARVQLSFRDALGDIDVFLANHLGERVDSSTGTSDEEELTFVGTGECFALEIYVFQGVAQDLFNTYTLDYRVVLP